MSILGVWMWPQSVRVDGAQAVVSRLRRAGVTDIYFLTKGLAGTTSHLGAIAPACCERDLLRELLDAAHAANIRVHAWLTSASDEHYKQLHPESGRCHYLRGKDKPLIALSDAGYLSYMEQIVRELCAGWDIDGLHLDYIRYNHLLYGWSQEDLDRYAKEGADIDRLRALMDETFCGETETTAVFDAYRASDESALALARARRQDVLHFAKTLCAAARGVRSDLILSAALMPEGAYEDTAFSDLHYGQNYDDAADLYDVVLPMAYAHAYDKDSAWVRMVAEGTMRRGLRAVMGLHAYEGGTGESLREEIAALAGSGVEGICLFREGATALAFAQAGAVSVYNPFDRPITRLLVRGKQASVSLETSIPSGEEHVFPLPFDAETVRVFTGDQETCVYLAKA